MVDCKVKSRKKQNHWWNIDCTAAKNRNKVWFNIWKQCGRPKTGQVYKCYKLAKCNFRRMCRSAVNQVNRNKYEMLSTLQSSQKVGQLWNNIRKLRKANTIQQNVITLNTLSNHFAKKFSNHTKVTPEIKHAEEVVGQKYDLIKTEVHDKFVFSCVKLQKYICRLKNGCSAGMDGIVAEHLKHALDTDIIIHLSSIFTVCYRFGVVPESFYCGIMVPLLKKSQADPAVAKNYRPVVISCVFSKLLEMYILDTCSDHKFSNSQFGFTQGRGTAMAVSLAEDVTNFCVQRGSPIYLCSLDAEGAFDALPHCVLFHKASEIIPDESWRLLLYWYARQYVIIKWNNKISEPINIGIGTRQGGLSSPYLFNLFYQEMVENINNTTGGLKVNNMSYNIFCYADDVLLASSTVTGLQHLINCAVSYVSKYGLRFNPLKTNCMIKGDCPFDKAPTWMIAGTELAIRAEISYLGVTLSNKSADSHTATRMQSCRRAYFSLQGAGLCKNGANIAVINEIWAKACRPILTYGCETINLRMKHRQDLDKLQSKLLKTALGLSKFARTTPLLEALKIPKISDVVDDNMLSLIKNMVNNSSSARQFYCFQMDLITRGITQYDNLATRAMKVCHTRNINMYRYIFNDSYANQMKIRTNKERYITCGTNGYIDTLRSLFNVYDKTSHKMVAELLKSF